MVQYFNDILAIEVEWMVESGVISYDYIKKLKQRNQIKQLQLGGNGRKALLEYDSMPDWLKAKVIEKLGKSPYEFDKYRYFKQHIKPNEEYIVMLSEYRLANGNYLSEEKKKEYYVNAQILDAIISTVNENKGKRRAMRGRGIDIWTNISKIANEIREEYGHTLPSRAGSLRNKVRAYKEQGLEAIITGKLGNSNSKKTNKEIEKIIMSLYVMNNKPYVEDVQKQWIKFVIGETSLVDKTTGELVECNYEAKTGEPLILSTNTIRNIINKNRDLADIIRNDYLYYNGEHRPHHHRKRPQYSLSQLSMDDRDLPPLLEGKKSNRVKAYFVWDLASECILGVAYSIKKDEELFVESIRKTFENLKKWGLKMPIEVEVEHHLVEKYKKELEETFYYVRWALPGNAQEKRAEHLNRKFKYEVEKNMLPIQVGRFYAKNEANRPKTTKYWDEEGMKEKQKKFSFEQIVGMYKEMVAYWNNMPHSKDKSQTRFEYLQTNINPQCVELPNPMLAKAFGRKTVTSLRRNQYIQVQYEYYGLPSVEYLDMIKDKENLTVYWFEFENKEVYIYEGDRYICTCCKIEKYQSARVEQTEKDKELIEEQNKYVSAYDKRIEERKNGLMNVEILKNNKIKDIIKEEKNYVYEEKKIEEFEIIEEDYKSKAKNNL